MSLKPIDTLPSLLLQLSYWFTKRKSGRVITPMRGSIARMSGYVRPH